MPDRDSPYDSGRCASAPLDRRALLKRLGVLAAALATNPRGGPAFGVVPPELPPPGDRPPAPPPVTRFRVETRAVRLRGRFDPSSGGLALADLKAHGLEWLSANRPRLGWLWIDGVVAGGEPPRSLDGSDGLELLSATESSAALLHGASGLQVDVELRAAGRSAIVHRLAIGNARQQGSIEIAAAATLSMPLDAGDVVEVLRADDAPDQWRAVRSELPVTYGYHGLRSAEGGIYPVVRLETFGGHGIIVAVSSATAWRIEAGREAERRTLRAGEYRSELRLRPGERVQLPDVITMFYRDGPDGAVAALREYLASVVLPPPDGWRGLPPAVFNTWFGYGCGLLDDGRRDSPLRSAARAAADAGLEVFVVDAGWYADNPLPEGLDRSRRSKNRRRANDDGGDDVGQSHDFHRGLGTWIENPEKWLAREGQGGSAYVGLRNFSDYVHGLSVHRSDGGSSGGMRFGLWFEPERFDPDSEHPDRVPSGWAIPGTSILDFSRPDVVDAIGGRLQHAIDAYRVDYVKVDSNRGLWAGVDGVPSGHFWTRWSAGFERLLRNLRLSNPGLYIEHCAGGLKRYWIGLARLADGCWLDDDVDVANVGQLLNATDSLLLPRQKHVLVTESLPTSLSSARSLISEYAGLLHQNGGSIGLSSQLDEWGDDQRAAAATVIQAWKNSRS